MSGTKSNTRKSKNPEPTKKCSSCKKARTPKHFYKVSGGIFPDGMVNICTECIRKLIDVEDLDSVVDMLRQFDRPYITDVWERAVKTGRYAFGEYMKMINGLNQYSDKRFKDSDGLYANIGLIDYEAGRTESLDNIQGEEIVFSEELTRKWGGGYKEEEYLKLEKFYQDMYISHDIETPVHLDILKQLSYLSVERDRMRQGKDFGTYVRISKTMQDMTNDAGFKPADRKSIDESTGVKSFSQVFEEVEKKGFRKPPKTYFEEDIVDGMMISILNYYNRIVGSQLLSQVPDEVKNELDKFYEFDDTPVEINDEDYEDLNFSVDNDEEDLDIQVEVEAEVDKEEEIEDIDEDDKLLKKVIEDE